MCLSWTSAICPVCTVKRREACSMAFGLSSVIRARSLDGMRASWFALDELEKAMPPRRLTGLRCRRSEPNCGGSSWLLASPRAAGIGCSSSTAVVSSTFTGISRLVASGDSSRLRKIFLRFEARKRGSAGVECLASDMISRLSRTAHEETPSGDQ